MGLRGSGVQVVQGVRGLRGLAEAKLKKSFYKTFLKLPIYYRNVASDVHLHGRFMSYGPQGLRCSGVQKRGRPTSPRSEKKFFALSYQGGWPMRSFVAGQNHPCEIVAPGPHLRTNCAAQCRGGLSLWAAARPRHGQAGGLVRQRDQLRRQDHRPCALHPGDGRQQGPQQGEQHRQRQLCIQVSNNCNFNGPSFKPNLVK